MPDFATFKGLDLNKPLNPQELVRALRFLVSAEYEAVQLYQQVSEATKDAKIKKAIEDITKEERVHAGEFLKMITYLDPEEVNLYQEGAQETNKFLKSSKVSINMRTRVSKVIKSFNRESTKCVTCDECGVSAPFIKTESGYLCENHWGSKIEKEAGVGDETKMHMTNSPRNTLFKSKPSLKPTKPADPDEPFAKPGEIIMMLNSKGEFVEMPWSPKLEAVRKAS